MAPVPSAPAQVASTGSRKGANQKYAGPCGASEIQTSRLLYLPRHDGPPFPTRNLHWEAPGRTTARPSKRSLVRCLLRPLAPKWVPTSGSRTLLHLQEKQLRGSRPGPCRNAKATRSHEKTCTCQVRVALRRDYKLATGRVRGYHGTSSSSSKQDGAISIVSQSVSRASPLSRSHPNASVGRGSQRTASRQRSKACSGSKAKRG